MKIALVGAAALALTALSMPVKAQEVISNPGRCAQYYPNANCENLGPGNPYTNGGYFANQRSWQSGYNADERPDDVHYRHRRHHYYR